MVSPLLAAIRLLEVIEEHESELGSIDIEDVRRPEVLRAVRLSQPRPAREARGHAIRRVELGFAAEGKVEQSPRSSRGGCWS